MLYDIHLVAVNYSEYESWFLFSGQDHQEDCAEAAVPELQALLTACDQGIVISLVLNVLLGQVQVTCFLTLFIPVSQRCKHFEIGGDKKGKGTSLF
jgi:hypothetical protein